MAAAIPESFSSWDKCMQKTYCNCCGGRGKRSKKHAADPPPPQGAYGAFNGGYQPAPQHPTYEPPQFAQFETGKKSAAGPVNEDALPAMPNWETAPKRKVLEEQQGQDVEMSPLNPAKHRNASVPGSPTPSTPLPRYAAPQHAYRHPDPQGAVAGAFEVPANQKAVTPIQPIQPAHDTSNYVELPAEGPVQRPYDVAYAGAGHGPGRTPPPQAQYPAEAAYGGSPVAARPTMQHRYSGPVSPPGSYRGATTSPRPYPAAQSPPGSYRGATTSPAPYSGAAAQPAPYQAYRAYSPQSTGVAPTTQAPPGSGPPSRHNPQDGWTVV
ncbi:MAG: hypothetical protein M1832_001477 [Thelocarpon impressellum]|nr:MAG: hypothetical protein M1832_001477 [Thelocarpon impressellum]